LRVTLWDQNPVPLNLHIDKATKTMDLNLGGRRALVTGASKGIGFSTARFLAQEGCDVILVSRTVADLEAARERILGEADVSVVAEPRDMSDSSSAVALARKYPDLDILVNNAGAIPRGSIEEIDEERWRTAWDLKVFGYINLTREYFQLMKRRAKGVIVNIIGNAGERMDAQYIAGSAANASLMAFTRALGAVSPDFGVRLVGINPGPVATDRHVTFMRKRAQDRFGDPDRWKELTKTLPFGRAAKPEEIAALVAFLASDHSAFTTGTIITIDGGIANRPA
jgi:NAD(P)-dependent dehydrogenase (short-subunit alcohol dehydrogenase family)